MKILSKVISGGQVGADQGGLEAARLSKVKTGGFMPKGFITLAGPRMDFAELYDMTALTTSDYPTRTRRNVEVSDGTVRIAANFGSPGERCTLNAINRANKPYIDILVGDPNEIYHDALALAAWCWDEEIHVLNVTGNATEACYKAAFQIISVAIKEVRRIEKRMEKSGPTDGPRAHDLAKIGH